jgi:predicted RNase H-like HicB family nuclease
VKYLVVFEKANGNYSAYVPDLPGCVATGRTRQQVEKRIREAIDFHLAGLLEDGAEIPAPSAFAEYEEVSRAGRQGRPM